MATKNTPAKVAPVKAVQVKRPRAEIMSDLCDLLRGGMSLEKACKTVPDAPVVGTVLVWVEKYPELGKEYAEARATGYKLLADEIIAISDESVVDTVYEGEAVKLVLDATAVARNRLRVDTRKWMLSKMLPKTFGDKTTQEITGAGGGPLQLATLNLNGLSDAELAAMEKLLAKTAQQ